MGDTDLQFRGVPQPLLADIVGRFTGRHTLDFICARYPAPVMRVVRLVATEMRAHGMLLLSHERREEWPEEEAITRGAATWRYVLDRVADPLAAWRRWRNDPVAVHGSGASFAAAVSGLLDTGVGRLWVRPDRSVDRDAVAGQLADHAARDAEFDWRWFDASDSVEPAALLVYVDDRPLTELDGIATQPVRRVIAGKVGQGGTVWRLAAGDTLPPLPDPFDALPLSHWALSVLGNMAAFQSLNSILAGEGASGEVLLPFGTTVHVHPDGRFETAGAPPIKPPRGGGAFVRAASEGTASPQQHERGRWTRTAQPLMAGVSPSLAWDDNTPLPVFPLPHRAMTIDVGDGGPPVRAVSWALSPSDVTAHALQHGIESLADQLLGITGHAAALNEAEWHSRAYVAWAEARAVARLARWPAWRLEYDDTESVEFRTLVRLVGLYLNETPRVGISLDPPSGLARADAAAGGYQRFALATSPLAAAIRALGSLLSAFQLGELPLVGAESSDGVAAMCHLALTETVGVRPERLGLVPHMLSGLNGVPLQDVLIGRFDSGATDA